MRNLLRTRRRKLAAGAVVLALAACGVAIGQWITTGAGHGSAVGGTMQTVTFATASTTGLSPLFPGSDGDLAITVTNPNGPLVLTAVQSDLSHSPPTSSSPAGCEGGYVTASASGLTVPVPAGTSRVVVPAAVHMTSNAPNACAGATFDLWLTGTLATP